MCASCLPPMLSRRQGPPPPHPSHADNEAKWRQLGELALANGTLDVAQQVMWGQRVLCGSLAGGVIRAMCSWLNSARCAAAARHRVRRPAEHVVLCLCPLKRPPPPVTAKRPSPLQL